MANTKIQIKRSTVTAAPPSLDIGELAYSYSANTLYIGNTGGTGVIAIGGASLGIGANAYAVTVGAASNTWANSVGTAGNNYTNAVGTAGNNYAIQVGAASNTWANSVGTAGNNYTNSVGAAGNNYAIQVGAASNTWANSVGTAGNNYTNAVGVAGNNYAIQVGAASNTWANNVGTAGNNYTNSVGQAANNYAAATYLNKTTGGTVSGDVVITGNVSIAKNLNVTGNVTFTNTTSLIVSDPLLYLAGNNYTSDVVDIGFVANYNNGSANLHTGLYREHANKQYYLFQNYTQEPENNHIDPTANGFTLAVLNADLITSNLTLGGVNAISWIASAFDKANSANVLAYNTGIGANAYAAAVGVSANSYAAAVGVSANSYAAAVGVSANAFATTIGAASNTWANTKVSSVTGTAGQIFSSGGTTPTLNLVNTSVVSSTYGGTAQVPVFTVDGQGRLTYAANVSIASMDYAYVNSYANGTANSANAYAAQIVGYANTNASNGSYISTGIVRVAYGGTGNTTFLANSVLIGNGTNPVWGLQSTTEGHLLQVSAAGAPQFAMLDGGSF